MGIPEREFRSGGISATVWNNTHVIKGNKVEVKSVQIQRNYQDESKEWKKTNSFKIQDLPRVISVAQAAFNSLTLKERNPDNHPRDENRIS